MSELEANKALVRRYYEIATSDLKGFENIVAADFVDHHFPPTLPHGPEGAVKFFGEVHQISHSELGAEVK